MKKFKEIMQGLSTLAKIGIGVALVLLLFLLYKGIKRTGNKVLGRQTKVSEVIVDQLRSTQKLKVLTMYREVLVNEYKGSTQTFSRTDDQLAAIYPARLDFGYDFDACSPDFIRSSGDTIYAYLPAIQILNSGNRSIDEAAKRVPIQKGFWTEAEKNSHSRFAEAQMLRECEAENCWSRAEALGAQALKELLSSFGAKNIVIIPAARPQPIIPAKTNAYTIKRGGDRLHYFKYSNESTLMCTGSLNEYQMLALADLLSNMGSGELMQVSLNSGVANIYYIHETLSKGSATALRYVRSCSPAAKESQFRAIQAITGASEIKAYEMDRNHNVMYTYPTIK